MGGPFLGSTAWPYAAMVADKESAANSTTTCQLLGLTGLDKDRRALPGIHCLAICCDGYVIGVAGGCGEGGDGRGLRKEGRREGSSRRVGVAGEARYIDAWYGKQDGSNRQQLRQPQVVLHG